MPKRRPPVELPPSGGRPGDVLPPGAGPPPRPPGEHPAWRALRGLLAVATWAALAALAVTGVWLWREYVPVPDLPAGADPASTLTPHQRDVQTVQDLHVLATWGLGFAGALWLAAIAATSATSRRIVATGALLALLGGGAAVWTGLSLPWSGLTEKAEVMSDTALLAEDPGPSGILRDGAVSYALDDEDVDAGTLEGLAWGHVLGALLVLVGLATAAGLARARRRRPDDDAMPAARTAPGGPARITLPADVEAPAGWRPVGDPPPDVPATSDAPAPPDPLERQSWWGDAGDGDPPSPGGPTGGDRP